MEDGTSIEGLAKSTQELVSRFYDVVQTAPKILSVEVEPCSCHVLFSYVQGSPVIFLPQQMVELLELQEDEVLKMQMTASERGLIIHKM